MMRQRTHIRKDDKVKVIAGKDKDKVGKILKVNRKRNRVLIENVNIVKRHTRPNTQNKQGGIIESEAAIHLSNVMLICSKCVMPMRIRIKQLEDGKRARVCRKCNEIID